jgi:hypothetical protein
LTLTTANPAFLRAVSSSLPVTRGRRLTSR